MGSRRRFAIWIGIALVVVAGLVHLPWTHMLASLTLGFLLERLERPTWTLRGCSSNGS